MTAIPEEKATPIARANWLPGFFVLMVGAVFGGSMVFLTPPFNVPDEAGHWFRCYQCSLGKVYASRQGDAVGGELPTSLGEIYMATTYPAETDAEILVSAEKIRKALDNPARSFAGAVLHLCTHGPI